jgi:hypothetical protein
VRKDKDFGASRNLVVASGPIPNWYLPDQLPWYRWWRWHWRRNTVDFGAPDLVVSSPDIGGPKKVHHLESVSNLPAEGLQTAQPINPPAANSLPPRKPGPKRKDDWPMLVAAKMIHLALYDPDELKNVNALGQYMKKFLDGEIGWAPNDPKEMRAQIVALLKFVRR